jgi:hypothetical protein
MYILDPLKIMQKMLEENYELYTSDKITEEEYLIRIKPIDESIAKMEMKIMESRLVLSQ